MRHGKKVNKLSRKSAHRQAMLANMAASLILHKRINTTLAKGKALRVYVEPLITKSKDDSTHSRRVVFSYLQNKEAITELFREISVKVADRPGGYTRVLKTGTRLGDNAEMCLIELVDYNENLLATKEETKAKASRRRRGSGKKKTDEAAPKAEETKKAVAEKPEVAEAEPEAVVEPEVEDTVVVEEEPVVEEVEGTAVAEEEPVAEVVEDTAVAEEEPVVEEVKEEPVAEKVEEAPVAEAETPEKEDKEEPAEDSPEEDQEEEKK
jgi:large subunit ribosomal protein L17